MFVSDGTLSAVTHALLLGITCLTVLCDLTKGSADFSGLELVIYGHKQIEYVFQFHKKHTFIVQFLNFYAQLCTKMRIYNLDVVCG